MTMRESDLGYYEIEIAQSDYTKAVNLLLAANIPQKVNKNCKIRISFLQIRKIRETLSGKIPYRATPLSGPLAYLLCATRRYGVIAALFVCIFLFVFSLGTVWDVRAEEGCFLPEAVVVRAFSDAGLSVGARFSKIDLEAVEAAVVEQDEHVSWAHVNRRGTVAYLSVGKNESAPPEEPPAPRNLLADRDGIVEEITVEAGVAVVKIGQAVKAGDLLISGVTNDPDAPVVAARGSVRVREMRTFSLFTPLVQAEEVVKEQKTAEISLYFFNKRVKIFKRYGNSVSECVIIEKTLPLKTPLGTALPFGITVCEEQLTAEAQVARTPAETSALALSRLQAKVRDENFFADVLSVKFGGYFTEEGYTATCTLSVLCDVAVPAEIKIS